MSDAPTDARRRRFAAYRRGHASEWIALAFLVAKGWRPLARRYGGKGGEIDLIVRRGGTVAFVEVKARTTRAAALEAVTVDKRRLFARCARRWLAANPWAASLTLRADLVVVSPRTLPLHLADAFPLE